MELNWVPVGAKMVPNWVPYGPRHVRMVWVLATFVVGSRKWPNLTPQPRPFLAPVASFGHRWGTLEPKVAQMAPFRAHFGPKLSQIVPNCPSVLSWGFNLGSIWVQSGFFGRPRLGCLFGQPKF